MAKTPVLLMLLQSSTTCTRSGPTTTQPSLASNRQSSGEEEESDTHQSVDVQQFPHTQLRLRLQLPSFFPLLEATGP